MGEYATSKVTGQQVKIGTCEDMYYLRADQMRQVRPERHSLDPVRERGVIRFRFPWPDEDGVRPGEFGDPFRRLPVLGLNPPEGLDHGTVQFISNYPGKGYNLSIPCPEGPNAPDGLTVHRNGAPGCVAISQQKVVRDRLVLIGECTGCGAKWRYEDREDAQLVIDALRAEHERKPNDARQLGEIANRIEAGYEQLIGV